MTELSEAFRHKIKNVDESCKAIGPRPRPRTIVMATGCSISCTPVTFGICFMPRAKPTGFARASNADRRHLYAAGACADRNADLLGLRRHFKIQPDNRALCTRRFRLFPDGRAAERGDISRASSSRLAYCRRN